MARASHFTTANLKFIKDKRDAININNYSAAGSTPYDDNGKDDSRRPSSRENRLEVKRLVKRPETSSEFTLQTYESESQEAQWRD